MLLDSERQKSDATKKTGNVKRNTVAIIVTSTMMNQQLIGILQRQRLMLDTHSLPLRLPQTQPIRHSCFSSRSSVFHPNPNRCQRFSGRRPPPLRR